MQGAHPVLPLIFQRHLANEKAESTLGMVPGSDPAPVASTRQSVITILNPFPCIWRIQQVTSIAPLS